MKKLFLFLIVLVAGGFGARAQSPIAAPLNLGFESDNADGSLQNWGNIYLFIVGDSVVYDHQLIGLTPNAHSGARALELRNCWNFTRQTGLAGSISLDDDSAFTGWSSFEFVPVVAPPTSFSFWYKYGPVGGDTARARLLVFDSTGTELGQGLVLLTTPAATYTHAEVAVTYHTTGHPAFMNLNFSTFYTASTTGQRQPSLGTWLQVDDVGLNTPLGTSRLLQTPVALQLFPNPANDVLNVRVAPGAPAVTQLELLNWCGQSVRTATANLAQVSLAGLAPGRYLVRLQTANGAVMMRQIVKQ